MLIHWAVFNVIFLTDHGFHFQSCPHYGLEGLLIIYQNKLILIRRKHMLYIQHILLNIPNVSSVHQHVSVCMLCLHKQDRNHLDDLLEGAAQKHQPSKELQMEQAKKILFIRDFKYYSRECQLTSVSARQTKYVCLLAILLVLYIWRVRFCRKLFAFLVKPDELIMKLLQGTPAAGVFTRIYHNMSLLFSVPIAYLSNAGVARVVDIDPLGSMGLSKGSTEA
ncbi:hypothetical protein T11_2695 [Trichinella zimbabwensis]|uniref:Uncharacterized protein n=1 Tax=Trichinella zimbabwensis TaxID=268475 RepID=A0A0V1H1P9_9BILA|nr:hypothetical protein T11_2695 [Trichinella zimbabwensis]